MPPKKRQRIVPEPRTESPENLDQVMDQIAGSYLMMCRLKTELVRLYHEAAQKNGQDICPNCKQVVTITQDSEMGAPNPHESIEEGGRHGYGCIERSYKSVFAHQG